MSFVTKSEFLVFFSLKGLKKVAYREHSDGLFVAFSWMKESPEIDRHSFFLGLYLMKSLLLFLSGWELFW